MKKKTHKLYLCGVDWIYEMGNTTSVLYPSVRALKQNARCWKECGIVEVTVSKAKVIKKGKKSGFGV